MENRILDSVFYQLYPLGAFGAPRRNDGTSIPEPRLRGLPGWIPSMERVGAGALYLGPVFESESHGYDTVDYLTVDRRLGANADLAVASRELAARGVGLYLDAVFNHVGRRHPFVLDVAERGRNSRYADWIAGYAPGPGPGGLPFRYDGWKGHYDLVRLDTGNAEVREYLIGVALRWIDEYGIAGLRLDAADCLDRPFMAELGRRCRAARPGFSLVGEVVHGDSYELQREELPRDSLDARPAIRRAARRDGRSRNVERGGAMPGPRAILVRRQSRRRPRGQRTTRPRGAISIVRADVRDAGRTFHLLR